MEAFLRFNYQDEKKAEAVSKAIKPDNLKTPKFLKIDTYQRGCEVIIKIINSRRIETLMATIDDLLLCVNAIEECFDVIEKMSDTKIDI